MSIEDFKKHLLIEDLNGEICIGFLDDTKGYISLYIINEDNEIIETNE